MKSIALLISTLLFLPTVFAADSPKVQLEKARKEAAQAKKDLMIVFSGSTWNQQSKDFEANILKAPEFKKESAKHFVEVLIDIPPTRQEAHKELLELETSFRFQGIPTVILADSKGRPYAATGAEKKEAVEFLKHLKELHKVGVERDKDFQAALKANGKKRAELLVKALKTLPQQTIAEFYDQELQMIEKADPNGETKYAVDIRKEQALAKEQERYNELFSAQKYEEIIKVSRQEGSKLKGEDAQRMKLYEVKALFAQKKYDDAVKATEALKKMAPESDLGKRSDQFVAQIKGAKTREERMKEAAKKPKAPSKPIVSKPVAIVTDINQLRKDAEKAVADAVAAVAKEKKLVKERGELARSISAMETELGALRKKEKASADAIKKTATEREKLARRAKAMKEVVENHEAMEKRKREISELEKKAADLQKQADALRKKAGDIRKGK